MAGELAQVGAGLMGAGSGAASGAQLGKMIGPQGAVIGAAAGALLGGISSVGKSGNASKADKAIQAQDPRELARLAEINRIRKSIGAGTDPLSQQQIRQAQQTGASTQGNIARVTGGNVGATIAGLTRAQRGTQAATNQALAQSQERLPFFENMAQQLNTRVSQRALEVGLMRRDQAMAEKAAQGKANSANIAGAIGALGGMAKLGAGLGAGAGAYEVDQSGALGGPGEEATGFIDDSSSNPKADMLSFTDQAGAGNVNQPTNTFIPTAATNATPLIDPNMQNITNSGTDITGL